MQELIGRRYLLLEPIGSGNMGTVYRTTDRLTHQTIALKQVKLAPDRIDHGSRGEGDPSLTLAQEFKILASLRHPNIISVLDYGFHARAASISSLRVFSPQSTGVVRDPYVTMELLENASDLLAYADTVPETAKIDLLVQTLQALVYLHRRGVLHRDLKPKNVLIVDGRVKVLDFGLSILNTQADSGEVAGTPSYMAPEVWNGKPASRQSDLYAVGIIAYRMFAGRHPFDTRNLRQLFQEVQMKAADLSLMQCSDPLRRIVGKLLAKQPEHRFSDAAEVIAALRQVTAQPLVVETTETRESFLQAASFVGREQEMSYLAELLNGADAGQGGSWLISGESGVGKSRLLDELRTRALVNGSLVLRGSANAGSPALYEVWREVLRWLVLLSEVPTETASILKPLVPDIEQLLERKIPDPPDAPPQVGQQRLFAAVEQRIRAAASVGAAEGQSLVLILEDLHWADAESLLLLDRITRIAPELPLLVIGTFRDDEVPMLPERLPAMGIIHLPRLTPVQTAELTEAMLGEVGRNRELISLLQRETEGNTFFLVELVRALAEEAGQLEQIGSSPLPMKMLTSGISSIIQRRLNRISAQARPLLRAAAVAGRQLDLEVLGEALSALDARTHLETWLSICADAAVLEVQDGVWRFTHAKLRDGVLSELSPEDTVDLNRKMAQSIEAVYQYSSKQTAARLAQHWLIVGDTAKEEQYAALAGEQAMRNGASQVAIQYLRRAIELQRAPDSEASRRKMATLRQQLGDAYLGEGQRALAEMLYREALDLFRAAHYRWGVSTALNRLGTITGETGDLEGAAEYLIEALSTAYEARALQVAVASLVAMAGLLARAGVKETALEYVALALHHPSLDVQTGEVAHRLEEALCLEVADAEAVKLRGTARELKEVIASILNR